MTIRGFRSDYIEELYEETEEQRESIVNKILGELSSEDDEISGERVSMINRIMRMGMKDRVKLAMKGDREARNILIRDSNRIVAQAVIQNSRITENEVEKIAAMRSVPEDVLRQIANNRNWARNYSIVHNLARNPRTPIANVMINSNASAAPRFSRRCRKTETSPTPCADRRCGWSRREREDRKLTTIKHERDTN